MGVMMKTPTRYAISIPNRFAFGFGTFIEMIAQRHVRISQVEKRE